MYYNDSHILGSTLAVEDRIATISCCNSVRTRANRSGCIGRGAGGCYTKSDGKRARGGFTKISRSTRGPSNYFTRGTRAGWTHYGYSTRNAVAKSNGVRSTVNNDRGYEQIGDSEGRMVVGTL